MSGCAAVFDWSVAESMYLKLMMMKKKKKRPVFIFKYGLISFYRKVSVHHKNMHGWYIRARPQWSFSGSLVSWQYLYELRGRDCSSDPDMRHNYQLFCYRRVVNNTERKLLHLHVINILSHVSSFAIFAFTCSCYVISKHTVFTSSHKQASQFIVLCPSCILVKSSKGLFCDGGVFGWILIKQYLSSDTPQRSFFGAAKRGQNSTPVTEFQEFYYAVVV